MVQPLRGCLNLAFILPPDFVEGYQWLNRFAVFYRDLFYVKSRRDLTIGNLG